MLECLKQDRILAMTRHLLRQQAREASTTTDFSLGDVVCYELNEYERSTKQEHPASSSTKYQPVFSGPARILELKPHAAVVKPIWGRGDARQTPLANLKRLPALLPKTLRDVFDRESDRVGRIIPPVFATRSAMRPQAEYAVGYEGKDVGEVEPDERHRDRRRKI
eukprot:GHVQ01042598.1.p1 GENE.GHVQ01042598.1~~GHVQ01042598.1.p1  ORF type:complete len:165 (+),score=21.33 GHVQ01042598.1:495-989(+)